MKKLILLLLNLFLFFNFLNAQIAGKFGINRSFVNSYGNVEENESVKSTGGIQAGFLFKYQVSYKIDLLAEINFETRGASSYKKFSSIVPIISPTGETFIGTLIRSDELISKYYFINIPVLFAYGNKKIKFYAGPNMAWVLKATSEYSGTNRTDFMGNIIHINDRKLNLDLLDIESLKELFGDAVIERGKYINNVDFGINVGALFYLHESLCLDFRINQGLVDMTNNAYDFSIHSSDNLTFPERKDIDRNFSIQLSVGYFLD